MGVNIKSRNALLTQNRLVAVDNIFCIVVDFFVILQANFFRDV